MASVVHDQAWVVDQSELGLMGSPLAPIHLNSHKSLRLRNQGLKYSRSTFSIYKLFLTNSWKSMVVDLSTSIWKEGLVRYLVLKV